MSIEPLLPTRLSSRSATNQSILPEVDFRHRQLLGDRCGEVSRARQVRYGAPLRAATRVTLLSVNDRESIRAAMFSSAKRSVLAASKDSHPSGVPRDPDQDSERG